jgi:ribosome maturation protein Sdo1
VNGKEGAIVYDDKGKKYFVVQYPDEIRKYRIGTNVEITSVKSTSKEYGDYYCYGKNLDI